MATYIARTYDLDGVTVPALRGVSLTVDEGELTEPQRHYDEHRGDRCAGGAQPHGATC